MIQDTAACVLYMLGQYKKHPTKTYIDKKEERKTPQMKTFKNLFDKDISFSRYFE